MQGEFGGIGHNVSLAHLWPLPRALSSIDETYELDATLAVWNFRAHALLAELLSQIENFACSAAVWTQTTDVEGEVNGLLTYDRRILRADARLWKSDVRGLYRAVEARSGGDASSSSSSAAASSAATMPAMMAPGFPANREIPLL
jgi:hypothetical protein